MRGAAKSSGALASVVALALALSACGDDEGTSGSDPASLVPVGSPVYGQSVVRPEGDEREAIEGIITATTGEEDPGGYVVEQLNEDAEESGDDVTYEDDIEPWLGERAAVFASEAGPLFESVATAGSECLPPDTTVEPEDTLGEGLDNTCVAEDDGPDEVGVIVETTDADAARASLEQLVQEESESQPEEASYEGVDYFKDDEMAAGVVGDFVVAGSEDSFKAAVDTSQGGEALADSDEVGDTLASVGEEPTASLYIDAPALIEAAERSGALDAETQAGLELSLGGELTEAPIALGADVTSDGITLTSSTGAPAGDAGIAESELLEDVPADAWLALGASDVGERVAGYVESLSKALPSSAGFGDIEEMFRRETGLELTDLYEPLGDSALFVAGTSPLSAQGAAVIETSDAKTSADLLKTLGRLAAEQGEEVSPLDLPGIEDAVGFAIQPEGAPGSGFVFQADDRLVVAYGEDAAAAAVGEGDGGSILDSDGFAAAADALGDYEIGTYVDVQGVAELLGTIPAETGEVTPEQVARGVDAFDFLASGVRLGGDRRIGRLVLALAE